jgi:hypothetical protein
MFLDAMSYVGQPVGKVLKELISIIMIEDYERAKIPGENGKVHVCAPHPASCPFVSMFD